MDLQVGWPELKAFAAARNVPIQYIERSDAYLLGALDGFFSLQAAINKDGNADQTDFETNFKNLLTTNNSPNAVVTTQYELNNKILKTSRIKMVMDGATHSVAGYLQVPGTFGNPESGRYIAGGWGTLDTYDPDDYLKVYLVDKDRLLAAAYGNQSDGWMQTNTPYAAYPTLASFTDDEQASEDNRGWYFWPLAQGNNNPPFGDLEFEPIGGYAFCPAGMYIEFVLTRPNQVTGTLRADIFWGKLDGAP